MLNIVMDIIRRLPLTDRSACPLRHDISGKTEELRLKMSRSMSGLRMLCTLALAMDEIFSRLNYPYSQPVRLHLKRRTFRDHIKSGMK